MSLDPAAQDKLMADLKQVDPGLQPMFLKTFLAEAANKRREVQREAEKQKQTTCLELKSSVGHSSPVASPMASNKEEPAAALAPQPSSPSIVNTDDRPALAPEPPLMGRIVTGSTAAIAAGKPGEASNTPPEPRMPDAGGTPTQRTSIAARLAAIRAEASTAGGVPSPVEPAGPAPLSESDWQAHLTAAIRSVQQPDAGHRAVQAKRILGEALEQLGEAAPLAVRNLTFCTEVARFGSFDALKSTEFTPGQKILLYAEVDNIHVGSSAKGYHWAVNIHGQIFDDRGNRVADYGSTSAEEYYQTPRHDFFVSKLYYLPRLVAGRYSLQLAIEDALGHKAGQAAIDFTIKLPRKTT